MFVCFFFLTNRVRDCGMNFEWNLFQFTARDCLLLAKVCVSTIMMDVKSLIGYKLIGF